MPMNFPTSAPISVSNILNHWAIFQNFIVSQSGRPITQVKVSRVKQNSTTLKIKWKRFAE